MQEIFMTLDDFKWFMDIDEECKVCAECDIFDKCQEENRNYCEKEQTDENAR